VRLEAMKPDCVPTMFADAAMRRRRYSGFGNVRVHHARIARIDQQRHAGFSFKKESERGVHY
jgi:hypothetical protein